MEFDIITEMEIIFMLLPLSLLHMVVLQCILTCLDAGNGMVLGAISKIRGAYSNFAHLQGQV